jgi:hypothetical protein
MPLRRFALRLLAACVLLPGMILALMPASAHAQAPATISGATANLWPPCPAWGCGLPGVTVRLRNAAGDVVQTTNSAAGNGWYIFRNVAPGVYTLTFDPPAGYRPKVYGFAEHPESFTVGAGQSFTVSSAAFVPVPDEMLNLADYRQTMDVNARNIRSMLTSHGELPFDPSPPAPQPFSPTMSIALGFEPDSAHCIAGSRVCWSAYLNGSLEVDQNLDAWLAAAGTAVPQGVRIGPRSIDLLMQKIAGNPELPPPFAKRSYIGSALNFNPYSQTYGYFEVTATVPKGNGFWAAPLWLLPVARTATTEIDLPEILGKDTKVAYFTIHTNDKAWLKKYGLNGTGYEIVYRAPGSGDFAETMHRFGVLIETSGITFYVDRRAIGPMLDLPADMAQPLFPISDLSMGGAWAGPPDATTPAIGVMSIEAFKAWAKR